MSAAVRGVRWLSLEPPLPPGALLARGEAIEVLLHRLSRLTVEQRSQLWGLASAGGVFVRGSAEMLPWVRGGIYLARTDQAPGLWIPTHRRPDVPLDLYARALRRTLRRPHGELAVIPADRSVVLLDSPRPLDSPWLHAAVTVRAEDP